MGIKQVAAKKRAAPTEQKVVVKTLRLKIPHHPDLESL